MNLIPDHAVTGPLSSTQINSFRGVKRGDINGDCGDCGNSFQGDVVDDREDNEGKQHTFFITDTSLASGEEIIIPITTGVFPGAALYGMQLDFDAEYLDIISLECEKYFEEDLVASNIISDTERHSAYFTSVFMKKEGRLLKSGLPIAYAHIRAKQDIGTLKGLITQPNNPDYRTIRTNDDRYNILLNIIEAERTLDFDAYISGQNPIGSATRIDILLPESDEVSLSVFNYAGEQISQKKQVLFGGKSSLDVSDLFQNSGIYILSIQTRFGIRTLRFVKI